MKKKQKYVAPTLFKLQVNSGQCACQCACGGLVGSGGGF